MTILRIRLRLRDGSARVLVALLVGLLVFPSDSFASAQAAAQPTQASATAPAAAPEAAAKLSNDELDSLVAPIALYPDPLLAQCLVASTYPLDIVDAQQWLGKNSSLKGDALEKAAQEQDWDASVQALVPLPDALKMLSENIKWTKDLGDAFLAQQSDVMEAVQRMRAKAKEAGKLETTEQQKVETKVVEQKTVIEIQPAKTEVVYVPSYSPTVIWGAPAYPYPPMYYPPYYPGAALVSFGVGMMWGAAISGGFGWGCGWGGNNTININNNNNFVNNSNRQNNVNRSGNSNWQHNAKQRGGVPYKDKATAGKYGGGTRGDSMANRQSQARQRQSQSTERGGGSRGGADRSGMSGSRGGGDRSGTSSSRAGSRDLSSSSRSRSSGSSSAFGGSSSGSRSRASSSSARGSSSMSRGGGGSRSGGGGGRRR